MTLDVLLNFDEMVDELELIEDELANDLFEMKRRKRVQRKRAAKKNSLPKEKKFSMVGDLIVTKSKTKRFFKTKARRNLRKRLNSFAYEVEDIA